MRKLFIKFRTTPLDGEHQFQPIHSGVYDSEEYVWNGYLKKSWAFQIVDENGIPVPYLGLAQPECGAGVTTDTELTNKEFLVKNALDIAEGDSIYHYMNEESSFAYDGRWRKVFLYVRVFDDGRWICVNLQHDIDDDIEKLKVIGLITDDMTREQALSVLAAYRP